MTPDKTPPILYYHRVSPDAAPETGVTPAQFRDQMRFLKVLGFVGTSLEKALACPTGHPGTGVPIALTFDDGYEDNFAFAAPILLELGFTATIFFVVDRMGGRADWTTDPVWRGHRLMDVSMARDLVASGFEAGSHTLTHPDLARVDDRKAREEISGSRERLSHILSCPVTTFCYPYGSFREGHPAMVRDSGYRAARTVRRYRPFGKSDRFRLACRPVSGRMGFPRYALTLGAYRLGIKGGDLS